MSPPNAGVQALYTFPRKVFSRAPFFFFPTLVKADFTTGQIAYIWIHATLNTVYSGESVRGECMEDKGIPV